MHLVRFLSEDRAVEVEDGTTLLDAARRVGLELESPCAAEGTCGKCGVRLGLESLRNVTPGGRHRLAAHGFVLSCDTKVRGPVDVETLARERERELKVLSDGVCAPIRLDPFIVKEHDPKAGLTRVWGGERLLATVPGDQTSKSCGVVVDLGTTTLVVGLVDLSTGKELGARSSLNPQARYAQDVMSRIKFASDAQGLDTMHREVTKEVRALTRELCEAAGVSVSSLYEVVYSGNTCMLYLALAESPKTLGRFPYTVNLRGGRHLSAGPLRLGMADGALVYVPPMTSAFVGGDISSGIVATALQEQRGTSLFIDVGTNGEMVIARDGRLAATSTAAGPAFEGMNISCGMRASAGAIDSVRIDASGQCRITVIGEAEPAGICGTGLIDAVAELVRTGVIGPSGRFANPAQVSLSPLRERLTQVDGKPAFLLAEKVHLTQGDVRQLQLAKAATRLGADFLLRSVGVPVERLDRVYVAGGFGFHLRPESIVGIGLLPPEVRDRIEFVGNTSKAGGRALLLDQGQREVVRRVVEGIEVVDLTQQEGFDRAFAERIGFQNAGGGPRDG